MNSGPPKWFTRFLRWYCKDELADAIEGDLHELYRRRVQKLGRRRADLLYFLNVILFFQPFAWKSTELAKKNNSIDMFRNNFKIATRTLLKTKLVTSVNVIGLAVGIACFVLIGAYVLHELSYEKHFAKSDRIYRLVYSYEARGETSSVAKAAFPLKYYLKENYPEVEEVVRFYRNTTDIATLEYGENLYTEERIFFTDPEVFDVFDFRWIKGDPKTALANKNSIVITSRMAEKYFGNDHPMGKLLKFKNSDLLEVTGVINPIGNSHLDFDFLVPVELQRQRWMGESSNNGYDLEQDWRWSGSWMYILVRENASLEKLSAELLSDGLDFFGRIENGKVVYRNQLQPLEEIHLTSNMAGEISTNGSEKQVWSLGTIAILILLVACINFINLSTAQASDRAREIGLRKVLGAYRQNLILQFLTESVIISMLSFLVSLLLIEVMLPIFNDFIGVDLRIHYLTDPSVALLMLAGVTGLGLISGSYPSVFLTRFKPVNTLKGNYATNRGNVVMRKSLVVGQFVISNLLIIGILVIQLQMNFIENKDLGFDKDQVIILNHGNKIDDKYDVYRSALMANPRIEGVNQGYVPGTRDWVQSFRVEGESLQEAKGMGMKRISYDFVDLFDMEVVAGRNFSRDFINDMEKSILLNEAAVRNFGWTNDEALGKSFSYIGGPDNKTRFEVKVVGVLKDANLESLYEPVKASVFQLADWGDIAIKFNASSPTELMDLIAYAEEEWREITSNWPFEYQFLDRTIEDQYAREAALGQMMKFFGIVSIVIACLGLLGLVMFTVKGRTKEIGIRKVLGATLSGIVIVVSRSFMLLVLISFLISIPLGYYLTAGWLSDFEYRIDLSFWIFIVAGAISLLVSFLTIYGQSVKAAKLDPVKTLRQD